MVLKEVADEIITTMNKKVEFKGTEIPKNWVGLAVFVVIMIMMSMIFADAANQDTVDLGPGAGYDVDRTIPLITGHSDENTQSVETIEIAEPNVETISFVLTWTDESAEPPYQNDPDEFRLAVEGPWENSSTDSGGYEQNPQGGEGRIELTLVSPSVEKYNTLGTGFYNVTIDCGDCGDVWPFGQPSLGWSDTGNDWELQVNYSFSVKGGNSDETIIITGESNENSDQTIDVKVVDENIIDINFTLTWVDEDDYQGRTNQPDEFSITVTTPTSSTWEETKDSGQASNPQGGEGRVTVSFVNPSGDEKNTMGTGTYEVVVHCGNCGDQTPGSTDSDDGNKWTLTVFYHYNVEFETESDIPPAGGGGQT